MSFGAENGDPVDDLFGDLARLSEEQSVGEFLTAHRELVAAGTVLQLAEAARAKVRVNAAEALRLAEIAVAVAQELGDEQSIALAFRAKANALWFANQNQAAIELYEKAGAIFKKLGNEIEFGRTLSSSIQPLIRAGDYHRALYGAEQAREIFSRAGDGLRLARLELNVANIFHRQDRFEDALRIYEQTYRQLVLHNDTEGVAVALHNMAVVLIPLNDFGRALEIYRKAREFFEAHGMPALVFQADYNIAYLYHLRGAYSRALQMLRETHLACRTSGDAYHGALCRMDQSEIYLELNMSEDANDAAAEAFKDFQALGMGYEAAKCLANIAIASGQRGRADRALELFAQARSMFVREQNRVWPSLIDLYCAMVLYDQGRFDDARRLCVEALEFFRGQRVAGKEILCRLLLGRLALRQRDSSEAQDQCVSALARLKEWEAPQLECLAHFLMGQIHEAAGDRRQAAEDYRAAQTGLESLRSILHGEELKIAFMKNKVEVYESLVHLNLERGGEPAAGRDIFECVEAAKSRSLRDLMFERTHPIRTAESGDGGAARRILELREELNWYYRRLNEEHMTEDGPSRERVEEIQRETLAREKSLLRLLRSLPPGEPEATGIRAAPALGSRAIQESLCADTTLIEYFRVRDQIVAVLVDVNKIDVFPLTPLSRVRLSAKMLHFQISKCRLGGSYLGSNHASAAAVNAHLRDLYQQLVAPIRRRLQTRKLILAPHDLLHQLPLHALFDGQNYLSDQFTIAYSPSASVYTLCQRRSAMISGPSLVLGVPDAQAPFIADEARAVAESVPDPRVLLGESATRQALEDLGPHSRLIHIATHGRFRRDNPMFSSIRLGDGYLTLYDLYQLRLPADLVTLSGCSTGMNVIAAGDELLGLVRGFLCAGARSLLLSLWDIHDQTTADFMRSFYSRLRDCRDKADALQAAVHELRQRQPHPYYWAPFFLTGATDP